jgi:CheY-like chemotaxis protein
LAMARQSGPRRGSVQLNALIEGAVDMAAYGLRTGGVEVRQELAAELPTTSADEDQLIQVLINLIVNAQHTMGGKVGAHQLTIRTWHEAEADALVIEVEDSGTGVPEDIAARVFDPFFTTKDVGTGTGMGLSVSRGMVEAHGGALTLARNGADGATFRVTLPILLETDAQDIAVLPAAQAKTQGRILIVDDEAELAALIAECLTPLGLSCDVASDGLEALQRIAAVSYDAVFTDVRMPGMDGVTFYARLQADHPKLATRLAFISGDVLHNDTARVAAIGDRPVIEKPFDPEQVREVALRLLATGDDT